MGPADEACSVGIPVPAEILRSEIHCPPVTTWSLVLGSALSTLSVFLWLGPWGWGAWKTFSPEVPFSLRVRRPWTSDRHIIFLCLLPRQCQAADSRELWGISAPGFHVILFHCYSLLCFGHLSMHAFPVSGSLSPAHPWPGGESITGSLLWRRFDINDVVQLGLVWLLPDRAQSSYAHWFLFSFFLWQAYVSPCFSVVASTPPSFSEVDIVIWFCKTLPWERWGKSTKDFPVVVSELACEPMIISTTFQLKEGLIKILFKCQNNYCGYG